MNLRKRALGLTLGIVWGLVVFIATIIAMVLGRGDTLVLIKGYYPGFAISYAGAAIGLFWGFVNGFVGGVIIAWLYDLFCKVLYKTEALIK
jgi:hypothetical protein